VASGIYACWSKDSSWEDDGIDNIVKTEMGSDARRRRSGNQESVEAMLGKGSLGDDGEKKWQADNEQIYKGEIQGPSSYWPNAHLAVMLNLDPGTEYCHDITAERTSLRPSLRRRSWPLFAVHGRVDGSTGTQPFNIDSQRCKPMLASPTLTVQKIAQNASA
jgi:hypothetical protein